MQVTPPRLSVSREQLPHILRLLDDESPVVRARVTAALESFGEGLGDALVELGHGPGSPEWQVVRQRLEPAARTRLRRRWASWFSIRDPWERLEAALALLARFLGGPLPRGYVGARLDAVASAYRDRYGTANARTLALFLFRDLGLRPAAEDYHRPGNSNLVEVLETGRGVVISLTAIYMLVGRRLGLEIHPCSFPGHFLARVQVGDETYLVDCMAGGKFLVPETLLQENPRTEGLLRRLLENPTAPERMVARLLNNLGRGYLRRGEEKNRVLMTELLRLMQRRRRLMQAHGTAVETARARFREGQVVRHRLYGYRGVIVQVDPRCRAGDAWYWSREDHPEQDQPWYSILVHESGGVTYDAQSHLEADESGEKVDHPLVPRYFSGFQEGAYVRNDRPWPGSPR